jgi:alginate O-acetyltransferase complex protein AlgI
MNFVSVGFIVWFVLFVSVSWLSANKYRPYILVAFGLLFVLFKVPLAGAILLVESLLCYYISRKSRPIKWTLVVVTISVIFIAFLLCKYFASKGKIVLPLGISYFTFRLIHYIQESYRKRLRDHSLIEFLAYMTFFPTYLVGPINPFPEFLNNLRRREWDGSRFSYGLERVVYGYAQLIILGNFIVNYLLKNWIIVHLSTDNKFLGLVVHSVQLWLDLYIRFSAYSSIAIGIAAMSGFTVPENFNYPFLATNIREFWQRWHMSLTNWCREYIFTPLAAITRKPFIAIGATMITIGIWHELSLRYILWGFYHAVGIIVYEKYSKMMKGQIPDNKAIVMFQRISGVALTLVFVILSFPVTTIVNNFLMNLLQ